MLIFEIGSFWPLGNDLFSVEVSMR
jgi:hypothetical protein